MMMFTMTVSMSLTMIMMVRTVLVMIITATQTAKEARLLRLEESEGYLSSRKTKLRTKRKRCLR